MKTEEMIEILSGQGNFKTNPLIFESALYFFSAITLNIANIKKNSKYTNNSRINFYGLIFSSSGSGKDFAFKTVEECFNADRYEYISEIEKGIDKYTAPAGGDIMTEIMEISEIKKQAPKGIVLGLEGTKEGLFSRAYAQGISGFGSLNITHPEFGDILVGSSELINKLKELYDGSMTAKVTKGDNLAAIDDITVNMMAYGSQAGIAHQTKSELNKLVKTGMFRRTFILDLMPQLIEEQETNTDMTELREYLSGVYQKAFNVYRGSNGSPIFYEISDEADDAIRKIQKDLIAKANDDVGNDIKKAEIGALNMIENLAYIIAFIELSKEVEKSHVDKAYEFYKKCRESTIDSFRTNRPYVNMYKILLLNGKMAASEMIEKDNSIPTMKKAFEDELSMLEEYCYINNKVLVTTHGKVTRYSIVDLPQNDNSDIIVSICMDNKGKKSIDYKLVGVPFFGKSPKHSIESLVTSKDIQSFLTVEVKPSAKAIHGHRRDDNAVEGQNMIAFDIDEGMTIDEAIEKLKPYTYILYTTKSHRVEKNGVICDRFRVLMPTKQKFYVNPEVHKEMYENIAEFLGFQVYDKATRNISRFWFTNPGAEVFTNDAENIDVSAFMPETKAEELFSKNITEIDIKYNDKSIRGIYRWFFANTSQGNRNDHLYRLGCFVRDLGEDFASHITDVNLMLDEPLADGEIKNIIASVSRK
jgi:hypothetical protein